MSRTTVVVGLGLTVALQFFVLAGMVVKAAMPLWTGTEIHVKTVPVDPRSMFRGNYARLTYEFGELPFGALRDFPKLRRGEVVYVSLKQGEDGLYGFANAALDEPAEGIFLRGRVAGRGSPYRIKFGIEAFFAPKDKALQLEQDLRNGGVAVLMVTDGGSVALKDVEPNGAGD